MLRVLWSPDSYIYTWCLILIVFWSPDRSLFDLLLGTEKRLVPELLSIANSVDSSQWRRWETMSVPVDTISMIFVVGIVYIYIETYSCILYNVIYIYMSIYTYNIYICIYTVFPNSYGHPHDQPCISRLNPSWSASQMRRTSSTSSPGTSSRTLQDWRDTPAARLLVAWLSCGPEICEEIWGPFTKKNGKFTKKIWGIMFEICDLYWFYHGWVFTELFCWGLFQWICHDVSVLGWTNAPIHQFMTVSCDLSCEYISTTVLTEIYPLFWPLLLYIHDQNLFKCH